MTRGMSFSFSRRNTRLARSLMAMAKVAKVCRAPCRFAKAGKVSQKTGLRSVTRVADKAAHNASDCAVWYKRALSVWPVCERAYLAILWGNISCT